MTSRADRLDPSSSKSPSQNPAARSKTTPAPVVAHPLKAHPRLFYTLLIIFILWIAALLTMYFTTVYHKSDVHVEGATTRAEAEGQ